MFTQNDTILLFPPPPTEYGDEWMVGQLYKLTLVNKLVNQMTALYVNHVTPLETK